MYYPWAYILIIIDSVLSWNANKVNQTMESEQEEIQIFKDVRRKIKKKSSPRQMKKNFRK